MNVRRQIEKYKHRQIEKKYKHWAKQRKAVWPEDFGCLGLLDDLGTTPLLPDVRADRYWREKMKTDTCLSYWDCGKCYRNRKIIEK